MSDEEEREAFIDKYTWKQVHRAAVWRPQVGEVMAGIYRGLARRLGKYGEYTVAIIYVPEEDVLYTASGVNLIGTIEFVPEGSPVKLTYEGKVQVKDSDHTYKKFAVAVGVMP